MGCQNPFLCMSNVVWILSIFMYVEYCMICISNICLSSDNLSIQILKWGIYKKNKSPREIKNIFEIIGLRWQYYIVTCIYVFAGSFRVWFSSSVLHVVVGHTHLQLFLPLQCMLEWEIFYPNLCTRNHNESIYWFRPNCVHCIVLWHCTSHLLSSKSWWQFVCVYYIVKPWKPYK